MLNVLLLFNEAPGEIRGLQFICNAFYINHIKIFL